MFFLANLENGEICGLDLGEIEGSPRWTASVQWSSDGRFSAMKTWAGFPGQIVPANRLLVLDNLTGEEYYPEIPSGYICDLVWEPDHHMLAAPGNLETIDGRAKMGLFLIGVDEKIVKRFLPEKIFGGGEIGKLAWGQGKLPLIAQVGPLRRCHWQRVASVSSMLCGNRNSDEPREFVIIKA